MNKNEKILNDSYRFLFTGAFLCLIAIVLMIGIKGMLSILATMISMFGSIVLILGLCTIGFSMVYFIAGISRSRNRRENHERQYGFRQET